MPEVVSGDQVADLVLRVIQQDRDAVELVGRPQSRDQPLEQLRQRACAQQLQLARLRLAQQRLIAAHLFGERGETPLQRAVFALEPIQRFGGRGAHKRFGVAAGHRSGSLPVLQARRSVTVRRSSR